MSGDGDGESVDGAAVVVVLGVGVLVGLGLVARALRRSAPEGGRAPVGRGIVLGLLSAGATVAALVVVVAGVDVADLTRAADTARRDPAGLVLGVAAFGSAFLLRAEAWHRVLPGLDRWQALAGIHLALGGNHVLPLRLGEPLRIVSVVRRAGIAPEAATASTVALRSADVLALLALGLVAGPTAVAGLLGPVGGAVAAVVAVAGGGAVWWAARADGRLGRVPGPAPLLLTTAAWVLEAVLVVEVARVFGVTLSPLDAVVVLAAAIAGQLVAVTPGGFGSYEAAATAGLVAVGVDPGVGLAVAVGLHAVKTAHSLVVGAVAVVVPAPGLAGNLRLTTSSPSPPARSAPPPHAPVVLFLPAHEEEPRVAAVVERAPAAVAGRPVHVLVVDDGSRDGTADAARSAGAEVVRHEENCGLGAAVRTGLSWAVDRGAAAVAFCDADGEYDPRELDRLVEPILAGDADYVVGSRFAGDIHRMRPHRRLGNVVLTRWVRWTVRRPVTDGQSGYRAFSAEAAAVARIPHDYNYAQVLTVDLLARGMRYAEVPITYRFRDSGDSFVRLGRYLRQVVPTVWRQLNQERPAGLAAGDT